MRPGAAAPDTGEIRMHRSRASLALAGVVVVIAAWAATMGTPWSAPALRPAVATKTTPSTHLRFPPATPSIRIEGEVTGVADGPDGTLTVLVDGVAQRQVAAGAGTFAVDLPATRASGMVSLEYRQPGVHFTSLLGSYSRLARVAGPDGRLTREECECTRLSAFSTGLQHVADMLLGRAPRSDVELENTVRRLGGYLERAVTILARLAQDPGLLPSGHDTGLSLLRDKPALAAYMRETHYALLEDPAATLADLPAARMTQADVPARIAFLGDVLDVRSPLAGAATVLEREGDAFIQHGASAGVDRWHTAAIEDGVLVLLPTAESAYILQGWTMCPSTNEWTGQRWELRRQELRRQWAGDRLEVWRGTHEHEVSYTDCPELGTEIRYTTSFSATIDLTNARLLTTARRFQGGTALPVFCSTADEHNGSEIIQCTYAVHEFARDGTGEIVDLGPKVGTGMVPIQASGRMPFSWAMGNDGAMHVQAGAERARYWVIDGGDGAALGVVYVADADRKTGNYSSAGYTAMIRAGVTDFHNDATVVGSWGHGTRDMSSRPSLEDPGRRVRIVVEPSGRAVRWYDEHPLARERWMTTWGRLYTTGYSNGDCVAPSAQCTPITVRSFRPLARVGDRIHGIEESYSNSDGSWPAYVPVLTSARPQFHEVRDMPIPDAP